MPNTSLNTPISWEILSGEFQLSKIKRQEDGSISSLTADIPVTCLTLLLTKLARGNVKYTHTPRNKRLIILEMLEDTQQSKAICVHLLPQFVMSEW